MNEINADDDPFEYDFNPEDLEMALAVEEQLTATQAHLQQQQSLFPALDHTSRIETNPSLTSSQQQQQSYYQYHHDQQQTQTQQRERHIDDETAKLIEDLKQKLYIQEHRNKVLENKLRDAEESNKIRELENLNLKRQVKGVSADQQSTQSKRAFPQGPPRTRSKIKKTTAALETPFSTTSSEIVTSMQSIHLSSQHPSPIMRQTSMPPPPSPMLSTQQSMLYTPSVKSEPSPAANTTPFKTTTFNQSRKSFQTAKSCSSSEPKKRPADTPKLQRQSELNASLKMLKVIFADDFREWNEDQSANFNMLLVPDKIRMFAKLFSLKFVPTATATCSLQAKEHLALLADEIKDCIVRSENPESTVPSLLFQFGLCLPICIDAKLHGIIHVIAKTLHDLSSFLSAARDQLIKEIKLSLVNSNIYKLVQALALYSFKKPPPMYHIVEENPQLANANSTEMISIAEKYLTVAPEIAVALEYEKPPPQAHATVKYILHTLLTTGSYSLKAILLFLQNERPFLDLFSIDTPIDILVRACNVLTLNLRDKNWDAINLYAEENKPYKFVMDLCQLLQIKEPSSDEDNWYLLCTRVVFLLGEICTVRLPTTRAAATKSVIFTSVIDFMVKCCEFRADGKEQRVIVAHKLLAKSGCAAILKAMKSDEDRSALDYDKKNIMKLGNLVAFYVDMSEDESHPARMPLLKIEKLLDRIKE